MALPFSHEAFLDVFGAYNIALWFAVAVLWLVTAGLVVAGMRRGAVPGRPVFALLAVHWVWSGIAYHWMFFRAINPAATIFAALFVAQAGLFAWLATTARGRVVFAWNPRGALGGALVLYGLMYPLLGLAFGLEYPRVPLFAVPCPTALITAGLLLVSADVPRVAHLAPIVWTAIGGSAALALGIRADAMLLAACALLVLDALAPSALGPRAASPRAGAKEATHGV